MYPETYRMLAARQRDYWWHRARRTMSRALLRRHGVAAYPRWLDLGCGPGGNLQMLDAYSPRLVCGVDLSALALSFAAEAAPRACLVRADISRPLPFADGAFDLVTVFNVLCHDWVAREQDALTEIVRVLRPGGIALLIEPAFPALARDMDDVAMAHRRYRCSTFMEMCRSAGLETHFSSYFTSFGFPLLLFMKALRRFRGGDGQAIQNAPDMKPLPALVNMGFLALATMEARLIGFGMRMPFGTTLVCVAKKPTL